jgi:hypothetical protein
MRYVIPVVLSVCAAVAPALAEPPRSRAVVPGVVQNFDPTSPGLHDYTPPTPVGRGYGGGAYFGAGYMEFLFSGGRTPRLPPATVYVGPMERAPYGNRRMQLRRSTTPRAGVYVAVPTEPELVPVVPGLPVILPAK